MKNPFSLYERYRRVAIKEIIDAGWPKDQIKILDKWVIEDIEANGEPAFLPRPLWDREAMLTRNWFATEEEALAEVKRYKGELL